MGFSNFLKNFGGPVTGILGTIPGIGDLAEGAYSGYLADEARKQSAKDARRAQENMVMEPPMRELAPPQPITVQVSGPTPGTMAPAPSLTMPLLIGGAALAVLLLLRR